jgi:ABC-type multidrug transport system permease subunit
LVAAGVLVAERKARCLRRLLTTDMSRVEILAGHFLAMFSMVFAQLVLLTLFAQLFLRLDYARAPLATLLVVATTALFAASLGLLIGALAQSQEQEIVFSLLPMFVLSALGGAWVPLEFTPEAFQGVAQWTPLAWTMDGLQDIVVRGLGLTAILPAAGMLTAYSVVLFGVAIWRFRFE